MRAHGAARSNPPCLAPASRAVVVGFVLVVCPPGSAPASPAMPPCTAPGHGVRRPGGFQKWDLPSETRSPLLPGTGVTFC